MACAVTVLHGVADRIEGAEELERPGQRGGGECHIHEADGSSGDERKREITNRKSR